MSVGLPGEEDDLLSNLQDNNFLEDTAGCVGWTWTDEENHDFAANCLMFSHLGETTQYQNCVRKESIVYTTKVCIKDIYFKKKSFYIDSSSQWTPELSLQQSGGMCKK